MSEWKTIESAKTMQCYWLHHEYYSHGQVRLGYISNSGKLIGVNANGTESELNFEPTHYQEITLRPAE